MGKKVEPVIPVVELLQLHIDRETEEFLCQVEDDSEWNVYVTYDDGTRERETFEVTSEVPVGRAVVLHRVRDGKEFIVHWAITVVER